MTTQPTEAVANDANAPVEANAESLAEQLGNEVFGLADEEQDERPAEGEPVEGETEGAEAEPEIEEEADDLPPIEAPVSWDAEAKERFAKLPRDDQEYLAKRESERERFLQSKSQEAARANQEAIRQATSELAQIQAQYANQYQQLAASLQAEQPDPMLQVTDPVAYAQQMRAYQQAEAQRLNAQQTAQQYAQQAQAYQQQIAQAEHAEQHRIIVENFPEYADPTTGPELQRKLTAVAKRLGYSDDLISQARASDILAMRNVADAFDKADKYDALQKTRMEKVRAAKGKPPVTTRPGVAQGSDQVRARNAQSALETALTAQNRDVKATAFYEYLKNSGQI